MGIEAAIGALIGVAVAAGKAAAATAVAHPILFTAAALGTAAGATTSIVGGVRSSNAAKAQRKQADLQLQAEKTQAALESEARQRQLKRVLATQNAIFGGSNVSMSEGTPSVIAGASFDEAMRQESVAWLYSQTRQSILGMQSDQYAAAGRSSVLSGLGGAGRSLLNFAGAMGGMGAAPAGGNLYSTVMGSSLGGWA